MKRLLGLHLRYQQSPSEIVNQKIWHHISAAQLFMHTEAGLAFSLSSAEYSQFRKQAAEQCAMLIAHGSYAINLASPRRTHHPLLEHEFKCAHHLGCTHFLLHSGSAPSVEQGIDALARELNKLWLKGSPMQILLENTAFQKPSIGSDITQFRLLLGKVDHPESLQFCIDTAHAYAAGYDIVHQQDKFINLIATTIGTERVALIHMNDSSSPCASNKDIHVMLGTGNIGNEHLQSFIQHPQLATVPIILELPPGDEDEAIETIATVQSWLEKV